MTTHIGSISKPRKVKSKGIEVERSGKIKTHQLVGLSTDFIHDFHIREGESVVIEKATKYEANFTISVNRDNYSPAETLDYFKTRGFYAETERVSAPAANPAIQYIHDGSTPEPFSAVKKREEERERRDDRTSK